MRQGVSTNDHLRHLVGVVAFFPLSPLDILGDKHLSNCVAYKPYYFL